MTQSKALEKLQIVRCRTCKWAEISHWTFSSHPFDTCCCNNNDADLRDDEERYIDLDPDTFGCIYWEGIDG